MSEPYSSYWYQPEAYQQYEQQQQNGYQVVPQYPFSPPTQQPYGQYGQQSAQSSPYNQSRFSRGYSVPFPQDYFANQLNYGASSNDVGGQIIVQAAIPPPQYQPLLDEQYGMVLPIDIKQNPQYHRPSTLPHPPPYYFSQKYFPEKSAKAAALTQNGQQHDFLFKIWKTALTLLRYCIMGVGVYHIGKALVGWSSSLQLFIAI